MKVRLLFFILVFSPGLFAQSPSIDYTVVVRNPLSHFYAVEMQISGIRSTSVDVALPAWAPGVYAIRDFAGNVQQFEALSRQNQPLQVRQTDKQTWRITKTAAEDVRVRYRVFSSALNDEMADITPAGVFMYVVGQTAAPVSVKYETDDNWKVFTAIEKRGDRYIAPDYHTLVASPVFWGEFKVVEIKDAPFSIRVVFSNRRIQVTELQIDADLTDIAKSAVAMFGSVPFKDYTFLVKVQPTPGSSSVGYLNSARIVVGENDFVNEGTYNAFLSATTTAFIKAWYGRAARSESMQPFDYSRESYSRNLWFTEGAAAYSADMLLVRTGILTDADYFQRVTAEVDALQRVPGRLVASLEDASWNVWLRGENSLNASVPYLLKGKIAGMLLDAEIRGRTAGAKTIDDVLRHLLTGATARRGGLPESELEPAIQAATGLNVADFFEKVIRGKSELEYNHYLQPLGVTATSRKAPATIQFGIEFERTDTNQVRIRRVIAGSPAENAKLDSGDVIVAMDDDRVTFDNLTGRIHSKPLGRPVNLTVMRGERLLNLTITPGLTQTETWSVEESLQATPEQVRMRNAWLPQGRGGK